MDRLEAMAILAAAVEAGSLSAAGRRLSVPVATLSRKLSDLEARLGARLLIRTTRKLTLTEAGGAYLIAARRILSQVDEAERQAAGEFEQPRGELVITAPTMFGRLHVLPVVADFLAEHPQIDVRLLLADRNLDLVDDRVDMAVRIGRLPESRMVATKVGALRLIACAAPSLVARLGEPANPAALGHWPCIAIASATLAGSWRFVPPGRPAIDVAFTPRLTVSSPDAAVEAAARGVGVARLLHYQCFEALKRGELQALLEPFEPEPSPVHLVHAARGQLPLKMRRFLDFAAPRLRKVLGRVR